jgi:hypothetical protein
MDATVEMLKAGPNEAMADAGPLAACIGDCLDCAAVCTACADACLGEEMVDSLRRCIRLDLDCADLCETTARLLGRQQEPPRQLIRQLVAVMATMCRICAEECNKHAQMHAHCRICADACRRCERSCQSLHAIMGEN